MHKAHSYNIIYIKLPNKIQCIAYNDEKNTISTSLIYRGDK